MKAKFGETLRIAVITAVMLLTALAGQAQGPFPPGEARDTIIIACSQCHVLTRITDNNLNAEQWEFTLYDMIARGAPVHENDVDNVRRYLIDNFATNKR